MIYFIIAHIFRVFNRNRLKTRLFFIQKTLIYGGYFVYEK